MKKIIIRALLLSVMSLAFGAQAQSYTNYWWTNSAAGLWNWSTDANWTNRNAIPNLAPISSQTNILRFELGTDVAGYTANNDIAGNFQLNQLVLGGTNVALTGNPLMFTNNGAAIAYVTNNALSGTQVISNDMILATNLSFYGSGTASSGVTIYGSITSTNAGGTTNFPVLSKFGGYTLTLAGANVLGPVTLGVGAAGNTLTFAADSTNYLSKKGPLVVSGGAAGATLNINGPTFVGPANTSGANLQVGAANGDRSVAWIRTNLTVGASVQVAAAGISTGAVYQTAGAVVSTYTPSGTGVFPIGTAATACYGYYRITGGTINATEIDTAVGNTSSGCFDIMGGTVTPSSYFLIGRGNSPQYAAVNVWGGTLNAAALTNTIGMGNNANQRGLATMNIGNGSTVTINPTKTFNMMIGTNSARTNILTVAANGTLITPQVVSANPRSTNLTVLNLLGGTLRANANQVDFIKGLNAAVVYADGAILDTQGFTVTNNQALLAPTANGLTGIPITGSGAGYIAAPIVYIWGGGGTGATAIAQIDTEAQTLTNLLITSPGYGYIATPQITLVGGGATTAASLGFVTSGPNTTSGGVTKLGTGRLILNSAASTYGGNTTNNAGYLLLGADNVLSTSRLVMNGGTLGVSGGDRTLTNAITLAAAINPFEANGGTLTLSGVISGAGGLSKVGTNHLILTANNTFTGGVTNMSTNAIIIQKSGSLGIGPKTVYLVPVANNLPQPHLRLDGSGGNITLSNDLSFIVSASGGAIINLAGNNRIDGSVMITGGGGFSLFSVNAGTLTMNGMITNGYTAGDRQYILGGVGNGTNNGPIVANSVATNTTTLLKQDSGIWTINSTNTYTGNTLINGGKLVLGSTGSISNSPNIYLATNTVFDYSQAGGFALTPSHSLTGGGLLMGNLTVSTNAAIVPSTINSAGAVVNVVGTLTVTNGNVALNGGTLLFDIGEPNVTGGPLNDLLDIKGDLTVTGSAVINFGVLTAGSIQPGVPYTLITFSGNFNGAANLFTNTQSFRGGVTFAVVGQTVTATFDGSVAALIWQGNAAANTWDLLTTSNWLNGVSLDVFNQADAVTFDDAGYNNLPVTLVGSTLNPSLITFNATKNYTFAGAGLNGNGRLVKQNSGTLTLVNANPLAGGALISAGTLQLGSHSVGSLAGAITNNASLVYFNNVDNTTVTNPLSGSGAIAFQNLGQTNQFGFNNNLGYLVSGNNQAFTGNLYVTNKNVRVRIDTANSLGSAAIVAANGGQLWLNAGIVPASANPISLAGNGGYDATPYGALRLEGNWSGPITLAADAGIGCQSTTAVTNSGTIAGGTFGLTYLGSKIIYVNPTGPNTYGSLTISGPTVTPGYAGTGNPNALANNVPLTLTAGTLKLMDNDLTVARLSGLAGNIQNGGTNNHVTLTVGADNASTRYSGTLTDGTTNNSLALVKNGTGSLTLSGANTFTGGASLNAGTVAAVSATALGNGLVTVANGATLRLNSYVTNANALRVGSLTLDDGCTLAMSLNDVTNVGASDVIYVTNALTLIGSGAVEFDFNFTKGAPALDVPYLIITNLSLVGTPAFTKKSSHYTVTFSNTANRVYAIFSAAAATNLVWTGDGAGNEWKTDSTISNWWNGATPDFFGMGDSVRFDNGGSTNPTVNLNGSISPAAVTVDASANYTFNGSGRISGATGLTKAGSGVLTITTLNDYSGITVVSNGTLSVPSLALAGTPSPLGASGAASSNLVFAGGNLRYTGAGDVTDRGATLYSNATIEVVNASANLTNTGVIVGPTMGNTLTKAGAGTWTLSAANTFSNDLVISAGVLKTTTTTALGNTNGFTIITNGAALDISGQNLGAEYFTVSGSGPDGNGALVNSGTNQISAFRFVTLAGDTTVGGSGLTAANRFDIRANTTAYLQTGGNPFKLTKKGANQFSLVSVTVDPALGDIDVQGGWFNVEANTTSLGNVASNLFVADGAGLMLWGPTNQINKVITLNGNSSITNGSATGVIIGPITLNGNATFGIAGTSLSVTSSITGSGSLTKVGTSPLYLYGTNTYTGGTLVSAGTLAGSTDSLQGKITNHSVVTLDQPLDATVNAAISGTGAVNKNNTNTLVLTNANSFSGGLNLNGGILSLAVDGALGAGNLNFNSGKLQSANAGLRTVTNWFILTSALTTFGADGTGDLLFSAPQINNGAQAKTLVISNAVTTLNSSLTNTGSLTKDGPGKLVLGGVNNNSSLNVIVGTLALGANASLTNAATLSFASETIFDASAATGFSISSNQTLTLGRLANFGSDDFLGSLTNNGGHLWIVGVGYNGNLGISGGLNLNGGTVHFDVTDPNTVGDGVNDLITVNGPLTLNGTIVVDVPPVMPDGDYTLITGITTLEGVITSLTNPVGMKGTITFRMADDKIIMNSVGASGATNLWTAATDNLWDLTTMNWVQLGLSTPLAFAQGDNAIFDDSASQFVVDLTNGMVKPTSMIFSNNLNAYTIIGTNGGGRISGSASLTKRGTNVLTMLVASNDFYGPIRVEQGALILGSTNQLGITSTALGQTNRGAIFIANGATLDIGGQGLGLKPITVSGAGYDGLGAIVNNGNVSYNWITTMRMTLAGDTTFGGNTRWDVRNAGTNLAIFSTSSNAYNLTKIGTNTVGLVGVQVDPALGNIMVKSGALQIETLTTSLGNPTNILTLESNASLIFWTYSNALNKVIVVNDSGSISNGSGINTNIGPITLSPGNSLFDIAAGPLHLFGPITGSGVLMKRFGGTLVLAANNSWTGGTIISNGTVQIGTNGTTGTLGGSEITNYGTLVYARTDASTWTNNLWGTGALTVNTNTGGLMLTGATNEQTGAITVNGGSLTLGSQSTNIFGAVTVRGGLNGAKLIVDGPTFLANSNSIILGSTPGDRSTVIIATNFTTESYANNNAKMFIGNTNGAAGAVIQNGGAVSINSGRGGADILSLGQNGGYGYYRLNAGALITGQLAIGGGVGGTACSAVLEQFDGTVNVNASWFLFGWSGGNGIVNLYNGTMYPQTGNDLTWAYGANVNSFGMLNLLGAGAVLDTTANSTSRAINLARSTGNRSAVLNLNGGTLIANRIFAGVATTPSFLNFNGSTLKANASSATFLNGLSAATIYSGGAVMDSDTNTITIGQPLLAPTGYGVSGLALTNNGAGYIGAPVVLITGGQGSNATAIAQVDFNPASGTYQQVTNILVTSRGVGYQSDDVLTAALVGGGSLTAAGIGSVTLAPNTGGGLTKLGTGTLTLTATNTYTGSTLVDAGALVLNGWNAGGGAITINANATLAGLGSNSGPVIVNGTLMPGGAGAVGTLVLGGLTLNTASTNQIDLGGSTNVSAGINDLMEVSGDVAIASGSIVNFNFLDTPVLDTPYPFITYYGNLTGIAANLSAPNLAAISPHLQATFGVTAGTPNVITVTFSVASPGSTNLVWQGDGATNQWSTGDYTNQWLNSLGWTAFGAGDNVLFDDTASNLTVNLVGANLPRSVVVNAAQNYSLVGSGNIAGAASLTKDGVSTLTIGTSNFFTGPVTVSGGMLKLANSSALGSIAGGTIVTNGATVDLNGTIYYYGEAFTIYGFGVNNTGAIINAGASVPNGIASVTLGADASVGGVNRFDIRGPGGSGSYSGLLNLSGYTLHKVGTNQASVVDCLVTNSGTIQIDSGVFMIARSRVTGAGPIIIGNNTLAFDNASTSYCEKPVVVDNGRILVVNQDAGIASFVTNNVCLNFDITGRAFTITNVVSGPGSMSKTTTGTLNLLGVNTYTGNTTNTAGALVLGTNASIANSPFIFLGGGSVFDVSRVEGGFALQGNQTLAGAGVVTGAVTTVAGATLSPGTVGAAGALAFTNNSPLTLTDTTLKFDFGNVTNQANSDVIIMNGNPLSINGTITVQGNMINGNLTNGTYVLIKGATNPIPSGSANDTRFVLAGTITNWGRSIVFDTLTQPTNVLMVVSGGSQILTWQGNNNSDWDLKLTQNWTNGLASPDTFANGDLVLFDDTSVNGTVNLVGALAPGSVTVNNNSRGYTWSGSGSLTGVTSLIKLGASSLVLNSAQNYSGTTYLLGGSLSIGTLNALPANTTLVLGDSNSPAVGSLNLFLASQTIGSLYILGTNEFTSDYINIASGQSLTVSGNVIVGPNYATATNTSSSVMVSGPGSFIVNNPTGGLFQVSGNNINTNGGDRVTMDMSGLANANINLATNGVFRVGDVFSGIGGDGASTLTLASNTTITAGFIAIGTGGRGKTQTLKLGRGSNVFNAATNNIGTIGTQRDMGQVYFGFTNGTLTLRGADGVGRSTLVIGSSTTGTGAQGIQFMDLSNHVADLFLNTLTVGEENRQNNNTNYFIFGNGTLDTLGLRVGNRLPNVPGTGNWLWTNSVTLNGGAVNIGTNGVVMGTSYGTNGALAVNAASLTVGGGTVTVSNNITLLTQWSASSAAYGTLNVTGGTMTVYGDILCGIGTNTPAARVATVTVNGTNAVLDLTGHTMGGTNHNTTNFVDAVNLQAGTLMNVAEINNGNGALTKSTAGIAYLAGTNRYSGATIINGGVLQVNAGIAVTNTSSISVQGGTLIANGSIGSDLATVTVTSGSIGGKGLINGNTASFTGGTLAPGEVLGSPSTLTFANTLTLNPASSTIIVLNKTDPQTNDLIRASIIQVGGTLVVTNLGTIGSLQLGDTFKLFEGIILANRNFTNFVLPELGSGLAWNTSAITNNGVISVESSSTPVVIVAGPQSQTNWVGSNVTFTVLATGAPAPSYQWFFGTNLLAGATSSNLVLNSLTLNSAGQYSVLVTNVAGGTNASATLTVWYLLPSPVVGLSSNAFSFQFVAETNRAYWLETKTNLLDPTWVVISGITNAEGATNLLDTAATQTNKFYRIGSQPVN
jgi:autotransporter-associated beta strand protein